jgi:hypothetical protein
MDDLSCGNASTSLARDTSAWRSTRHGVIAQCIERKLDITSLAWDSYAVLNAASCRLDAIKIWRCPESFMLAALIT